MSVPNGEGLQLHLRGKLLIAGETFVGVRTCPQVLRAGDNASRVNRTPQMANLGEELNRTGNKTDGKANLAVVDLTKSIKGAQEVLL